MNRRLGSNSIVLICRPEKARQGRRSPVRRPRRAAEESSPPTAKPLQPQPCSASPTIPSGKRRRQHEKKKQKERASRTLGKYRNEGRPHNIRGMHQEAKRCRRLLPPAQQHQNQNAVRQVENEQTVSRPGVAQLRGIHVDRHQSRNRQKHARRRQPALDPANLAGIGGSLRSPKKR